VALAKHACERGRLLAQGDVELCETTFGKAVALPEQPNHLARPIGRKRTQARRDEEPDLADIRLDLADIRLEGTEVSVEGVERNLGRKIFRHRHD
jgi:hypothetical protein